MPAPQVVDMAVSGPAKISAPTADVPSGSKARLNLPAGKTASSWTKNGAEWEPPPAPVLVDPAIHMDDEYQVTDTTETTFGAMVRWQPGAPAKQPELQPGRGDAAVKWQIIPDDKHISYYEVDLDPRPPSAQLPRKVMRAAPKRRNKRAVTLEGLPPGFYTARVRAVRKDKYGRPVSSDWSPKSDSREVVPVGGPYKVWVRIVLALIGFIAAGGAVALLVTGPLRGNKAHLNGWALAVAALVTLALVTLLSVVARVRDLLTGPDNRISTSRVNVALWTVAIAFGITTLAVFAFGAHQYHKVNPCGLRPPPAGSKNPDRTKVDGICVKGRPVPAAQLGLDHTFKNGLAPNYLVLLGAPFVTLASSALIVNQQVSSGNRQKVQSTGPNKLTYALANDDGSADLVDSQYLIFTGVLLFYFFTSFIANPSALPSLPWGLVGLTGVSAGTYLLNKGVTTNGLSVQGLTSNSVKEGGSARVVGRNFLPEGSEGLVNGGLSISLDGTTAPITKVSNTDVTFTVNIAPGTYNVQLTTAANVSDSAGSLQVTKPSP